MQPLNPDSCVQQETQGGGRGEARDRCSSYLDLCDQDICDASKHCHKVKHIPGRFQVVLKGNRCIMG